MHQSRAGLLRRSVCAPLCPCTSLHVPLLARRCDGSYDCRVWIGADFWATPNAMVHELGHNLYLGHAGAVTNTGQYDECECSCRAAAICSSLSVAWLLPLSGRAVCLYACQEACAQEG